MYLVHLFTFWLMQAVAQVLFKYGSEHPGRWLPCFLGGHLFGVPSIVFLMALYRVMNPNLALGLGAGGAFLSAQLAIAAVFRSSPTGLQYLGMFLISGGMALFTVAKR